MIKEINIDVASHTAMPTTLSAGCAYRHRDRISSPKRMLVLLPGVVQAQFDQGSAEQMETVGAHRQLYICCYNRRGNRVPLSDNDLVFSLFFRHKSYVSAISGDSSYDDAARVDADTQVLQVHPPLERHH